MFVDKQVKSTKEIIEHLRMYGIDPSEVETPKGRLLDQARAANDGNDESLSANIVTRRK